MYCIIYNIVLYNKAYSFKCDEKYVMLRQRSKRRIIWRANITKKPSEQLVDIIFLMFEPNPDKRIEIN